LQAGEKPSRKKASAWASSWEEFQGITEGEGQPDPPTVQMEAVDPGSRAGQCWRSASARASSGQAACSRARSSSVKGAFQPRRNPGCPGRRGHRARPARRRGSSAPGRSRSRR
jgi:hypothetical protein